MTDPIVSPRSIFDPRVTLATSLASQPGVYALLVGSGASTGAGIPTGWGVVEALVRKLAAASLDGIAEGQSWEQWWHGHADGAPLGYSTLLEGLASTPPERRALLAEFFEPSEEDRELGRKVPGPAHKAIAKLVARGTIRIIVTTNFDRLIEQALEAEGIMPQVISSDASFRGMAPPQHMPATVIKLNGDYASLDQRNTVEELSSYPESTTKWLTRIFDEYGLLVSGWSGDWDLALLAEIERTTNRRYPLYWTARTELGAIGKRLTARPGAHPVLDTTADDFFPDILARVEAVEQLTESPASLAMKLARLRRTLPDPVRHLELRDLFDTELDELRRWTTERAHAPAESTFEAVDAEFDEIFARTRPLLELFTQGILLDRDRQHTDLWVWVLQQALDARHATLGGSYLEWWENLAHYPALLLYRAGTMAALAAKHEEVIIALATQPTWSSPIIMQGAEVQAHGVLHPIVVLDREVVEQLPRWGNSKPYFANSRLLRKQLEPIARELASRPSRLLDRMEYRIALADHLFTDSSTFYYPPYGGEFLGVWPYRDDDQEHLQPTEDFLKSGDTTPWAIGREPDTFATKLKAMYTRLRSIRPT